MKVIGKVVYGSADSLVKTALSSCSLTDRINTLRDFVEPEDLISQ